jgi:hypothetical protein
MLRQQRMDSYYRILRVAVRPWYYPSLSRSSWVPVAVRPILADRKARTTARPLSSNLLLATLTPILVTLLLLTPVSFVCAQWPQSPRNSNPSNATSTPLGGPAVTLHQHSQDWFDFQVRQGGLRARLALHFKERSLTFYPERLPTARALEWPLFVDMAPLLRAGLQAAIPDAGKMPAFSFSIRLVMYPEMSYRVAYQSVATKKWDIAGGRPRASFMNSFVSKVANDSDTYAELKTLFAALGYRIALVSLEKVLVAQARDLPFHAELLAQGIAPRARVPYDAILWFKAQKSN